jgi:PhnB protein
MASQGNGVAEALQTVTPHLVIKGAAKAIDYYVQAFGAEELCRMSCPQTGAVMHAALRIGSSQLYLADEFPEMGSRGPELVGGSPVTIHLYVDDVDEVYNRAVEAGATGVMPPADMFWGDRFSKVIDPFGHHWSIATHVEDLTPEQMKERMATAFA